MPLVNIEILGQPYRIQCAEGEEERLLSVAQELEQRLVRLKRNQSGAVPTLRLVLLAAVELTDALRDVREGEGVSSDQVLGECQSYMTSIFSELAERLEGINKGLSNAA